MSDFTPANYPHLPSDTPIHDALRDERRRNARDYAQAVADLDAAETVADLIYVGGWDA